MAYDAELAARVARIFARKRVRAESKPMMGGLLFKVDGKMCVGVEKSRLMVRLDPAEEAAALERPGCRPMDFTGRPLRGYVFVDIQVLETEAQVTPWLELALDFNPRAKASKKIKRKG